MASPVVAVRARPTVDDSPLSCGRSARTSGAERTSCLAERSPRACLGALPDVVLVDATDNVPAELVGVRISVDASGSVVKAEAVPKPGLHPALRDEAVKAASWWKFQPARLNGHPVPAEIVVQFNFAASR